MHWNNNNGHAKKQQHWINKKKHTSLMIADRSHNKNEELGYVCVCARARVYLSNAWEKCHQKKKKTAEKNLQEQSEDEEEEEKNIWERDIWARDTLHYPYPWEKEHTGSLMAWTDAIQELARSCEILVLADASNIPGRKKDGVLGMSWDDDHEKNNKEPRRAWAVR
jgi:hypothetical protein